MAFGNCILRLLADEAASGTGPTALLDGTTTPLNHTITYGGGSWTSIGSGRGLNMAGATGGGAVSGTLAAGNKIYDAIDGGTTLTLEIVFRTPTAAPSSFTGAFMLWDNGTGDSVLSVIYHAATGLYRCYFGNDAFHRTVSLSTDTVYRLTYVYDSAQATADERIRLYIDGSRTGTVNSNPGQNDTIQTAMPTNIAIGLLNYPDLGGQYQGALFYAALYDGAATDSDVTAHDAALAANNDADPDAPAAAAVSPGGGGDHFRTRIR